MMIALIASSLFVVCSFHGTVICNISALISVEESLQALRPAIGLIPEGESTVLAWGGRRARNAGTHVPRGGQNCLPMLGAQGPEA